MGLTPAKLRQANPRQAVREVLLYLHKQGRSFGACGVKVFPDGAALACDVEARFSGEELQADIVLTARAPLSAPTNTQESGDWDRNGGDDDAKFDQRGSRKLFRDEAQPPFADVFNIAAYQYSRCHRRTVFVQSPGRRFQ